MSAPCSVCGVFGVRLYVPLGERGGALERIDQWARCNGHVPDERPALLAWAPYVPEASAAGPSTLEDVVRALAGWLRLPEAAHTPVWTSRFGWIDVENAPGAPGGT